MSSTPLPSLEFEKNLWRSGAIRVAGLDEAGRGAWAGPVAAAAVILPADPSVAERLRPVRDSKLMAPRLREIWAPIIKQVALVWGVGLASAGEIEARGILPATRLAALRALEGLEAEFLLTDYLLLPSLDLPQIALVKGDQRSLSAAAASVLAKTSRDALMLELEAVHPGYGFARHKGYGTPQHRMALLAIGRCPIHRVTFSIPG
jgi:ribonuclease HII